MGTLVGRVVVECYKAFLFGVLRMRVLLEDNVTQPDFRALTATQIYDYRKLRTPGLK